MAGDAARLVAASMVVAAFAAGAEAAPRTFAIHSPRFATGVLYELDQTTAQSSFVANLLNREWGDLTGRPGDAENLYAIGRIPGGSFQNRVSTINVTTGATTDLFTFTPGSLGLPNNSTLQLEGITFHPHDSSVVTLGGYGTPSGGTLKRILFDLDLDTGAVSNLVMANLTSFIFDIVNDLSYSPAGSLYTIQMGWDFATLDPSTGGVTSVVSCVPCIYDAFEFDLFTGQMFAMDAAGNLVRISPSTAATLQLIGSTGLSAGDVSALAFMVPEPGTGALLAIGLALLAARRRHARR